MLKDVDRLMAERGVDWILAMGEPAKSAEVHYLVQGAKAGHAYILLERGKKPFLICGPMEREEARAAGLDLATTNEYGAGELAREAPNPLEYERRLLGRILDRHGVRGRVAIYGARPVHRAYALLRLIALDRKADLEIVEEPDVDLLAMARLTKSEAEAGRIRALGLQTCEIVDAVVRTIRAAKVENGVVVKAPGAPLKVGDVKEIVTLECARRRLEEGGDTIFAPGRDAAFPHSRGTDGDPIPVGRLIIFDIFPREKNGGYHFDMTRTYCVGRMPERARAVYAAVAEAQSRALGAIAPGKRTRDADLLVSEIFESKGFATLRKDPSTTSGYCHSLGHGVGLDLHERPRISQVPANVDVFAAGQVVTVEPGLYFPDEGLGARVEDTVLIREDGTLENLTPAPKEPEIEVAGAPR
jgi:Xaa-Pro aminopeptidase